ncbi:5'-nucleotidase [Cryobacterium zongtaii]|uniref:5'-nucleotidase n=1 Tax=Cryobacterium zongtaii TaxID=1259217 RepID=A0A2S3ZNS3_9MICO|nr:5'-nucleotidase [Cryobacterium zongtaii]POH70814.1 5'-nucleotidase [Cryobacterium zongtaii]
MAYDLSNQLVIGIASSALFDLTDSDAVFQTEGEEAYRAYQEEHIAEPLLPGIAFPFIQRLLSLNVLAAEGEAPFVEVIVLSKNDPDTGLRVMRSIAHHHLPITRAVFMQGRSPHMFMPAFKMVLFLSADKNDVRSAVALGHPAGQVLDTSSSTDDSEDLRIAFDFDGVLSDDSSEKVMQESGLAAFHDHEVEHLQDPMSTGLMRDLLAGINRIQRREEELKRDDPTYRIRVHVALVTARNAPSHERAIRSLKDWGVTVNDAFFLGGIEKADVLEILKPHLFFDDQAGHLKTASRVVPSVHVPFGVTNEGLLVPAPVLVGESASARP